jgi:TonB-linked SusC/RagA family outer membrane protein
MRFYQISFRKLWFISLILLYLFTGELYAQRTADKIGTSITVNLKAVDDSGSPIPHAQVVIGEGVKHTETDENGSLSILASAATYVTISSPGFEKVVIRVGDLAVSGTVKLIKSKLYMTSEDIIPLPFLDMKKRNITGGTNVISGTQLEKYPSNDIRNAFIGLAPGLEVIEYNGSTGISPEEKLGKFGATEKIGMLIRGRSPMIMIDDMPGDFTEIQLNPEEIESVSVIKDIVAKSIFGPQAADGIIFVRTKRGSANERILNVNIENGVSVIGRFPEWTTGAEFATLNNQAKTNSGFLASALYSDQDIAAYAKNDPYDMYHPSSNYRELMLKNTKSFTRASLSSRGGSDAVQYFANVGYNGEGDIYNTGPKADFSRINTRANLDIKVNNLLKIRFDFFGGLNFRRSPNYGYDPDYGADNANDAALDIVEFDRVIGDLTSISPIAFPIYANNDPSLKSPWYGVTPEFVVNPMGNLLQNGYYTENTRTGKVSAAFDLDLSPVLKGLKSTTFFGLDASYLIRVGKATDYWAYNVIPSLTSGGADTIILTKAHDGVDMVSQGKLHDYYYQRIAFYENLSFNRSFGLHDIQSTLTYYIYKISKNQIEEPQREQSLIWTGTYSFNNKFTIQGVLNYTGTYSYDKGKRYAFFPSLGVSWVISEENFMSNLKFFNYLKMRAEAGIMGDENFDTPFLYRDSWTYNTSGAVFGAYSTNQWFGSTQDNQVYRTAPGRTGNPEIGWEKRKEFNIGLDALMFGQKVSMELNYYYQLRDGEIAQLNNSLPFIAGISAANPYYNYNKTAFSGVESAIQYTNKIGDFRYSIGASAVVQNSKILKYDEPDYSFAYQTRIGKPADSYWGLTNIGKFQSDAEALEIPPIYDPVLHAGDLKYQDMNNDLMIDDNDQSYIGHTAPRLYYGLNVRIFYKSFEMTLIGTGRAFYDIPMTNRYFWNGWGDNIYSNFVRDNVGGAYPKLTYYKVNNNFVSSDFWLTKGGYFKIQNVEFAYNLKTDKLKATGVRGVRFFMRGANLLTLSKVKDVDPESINSGVTSYPLYKTFTGGINLTF